MRNEERDRRLEQGLRFWEDQSFLYYIISRSARLWPDMVTEELRNESHSLGYTPEQINDIRQRLLGAVTSTPAVGLLRKGDFTETDPIRTVEFLWDLFGWCRSSRRIYQVPGDLQLLLQATTLRGFWNEIKFSFDAFAISLEEPLEYRGIEYDSVLFHRYGDDEWPAYSLVFLPRRLESYVQIDSRTQHNILQALQRRNGVKLSRLMKRELAKQTCRPIFALLDATDPCTVPTGTQVVRGRIDSVLDTLEGQISAENDDGLGRLIVLASRLVFGLALYLQNLPITERRDTPFRGLVQRATPRIITQGAQVCLVQNLHSLTGEERSILRHYVRGIGREISPHFREGYFSRPPGQGHDPTAQKTIWHRPTIVKRDSLPEGALPYGSKTEIR